MTTTNTTHAGLYIHVPFCSSVCPYCDFAVTIAGESRRQGYVTAFDREASLRSGCGLVFDSIYLGGGTPSSLTAEQLGRLLEAIRSHLEIAPDVRLYLEANPEDVTGESVREWRRLGIDTVSLGLQSFDDEVLQRLSRGHTADRGRLALDTLQGAGFATVSADLIYAVDGQSAGGWLAQLEEAARRSLDHLSCYQLTFHTGTIFGRRLVRGTLFEMPNDAQSELFLLTHLALADRGYEGYEVSNFAAAPGHRSYHNMKYWTHVSYLGLGPSAHSFDGRRRWWNRRKVRLWQREVDSGRLPEAGGEVLTDADLVLEAVMLGLRTTRGVDLRRLQTRFGVDLVADNREAIEAMVAAGHVEIEGAILRPTITGMAIADTLARNLDVPPGA